MKTNRKNQKAIMIYVPDFIHDAVKEITKEQGMTLTSYVLRAIVAKLNMEKKEKIKY